MIAITLVAGAAVFGFVNGQAGSSAQQYGGQVQTQINALGEKFAFAYTYFPMTTQCPIPLTQCVSVSIYNSGSIGLSLVSLSIQGATPGKPDFGQIAVCNQTSATNGACLSTSSCAATVSPNLPTQTSNPGVLSPNSLQTYTFTLPINLGCLIAFASGEQYTIFAIGQQGYNTQEIVTR
jgi:hypothetical protein